MLTQSERPQTFSSLAGQKLPKVLMQSIVKSPKTSPKSLILCGGFGCGKTSIARIFAKALNCEHPKANGDPCLKCSTCLTKLEESPYYIEYDSSQLKLDTVRSLVDTWYVSISNGYRVIVFDECHLLSAQVQSSLLKVLEDVPPNTFFVCCTTDLDKMKDTIRSRSLEIKLSTVDKEDMAENLKKVAEKYQISIDDEVLDRICKVSNGHMRNAHMELEKYSMIGREDYLSLFKSAYDTVHQYFMAVAQRNQTNAFKAIDQLLQFPLVSIRSDLEAYILQLTKSLVTEPNELVKLLGANTLKLVKLTLSDWFTQSFQSDVEIQTALLCVYQIMSETQSTQRVQTVNANARR